MKALYLFRIFKCHRISTLSRIQTRTCNKYQQVTIIMIIWKIWIGSLQFRTAWIIFGGISKFLFHSSSRTRIRMELPHRLCVKGGDNNKIGTDSRLIFGLDLSITAPFRRAKPWYTEIFWSYKRKMWTNKRRMRRCWWVMTGSPKDSVSFPNLAAWPKLSPPQRETFREHQLQLVIVHALQTWETYGR